MQTKGFKYVCMWCAATIAEYPDVWSERPIVESVCNKRKCLEKASEQYKAARSARRLPAGERNSL